jgi:hypothetical protein
MQAKVGGFSVFTTMRMKPVTVIHDIESHYAFNISEDRAFAIYSETEVQEFPKELKHLTKLKYVKTQKSHSFNQSSTFFTNLI